MKPTPTTLARRHAYASYGYLQMLKMSKFDQARIIKAFVAGFRAGRRNGK